MNERKLIDQRRENLLWTLGALSAQALVMALLGTALVGTTALMWAIVLTAFMLAMEQRAGAAFLRRQLQSEIIPASFAPELHRMTRELAARAGLNYVPSLHYIPTPLIQAMATGSGRNGVIALSEGLVRALSHREVAAVIAHEIWHLREGDLFIVRLAMAAAQIIQWLCLGWLLAFASHPGIALDMKVAWAIVLLLVVAPTAGVLFGFALSRTREFDADAGAAALTNDPAALASALRKLERTGGRHWETLVVRSPVWSRWLSTHPPAEQRVARLIALGHPRPGFCEYRFLGSGRFEPTPPHRFITE